VVGFCVRKQAVCSRDLSAVGGQFRLGFQSLQLWDEETGGQSVLHIPLTSQCTEWDLLSFPPLAGRRTEAQRMLYLQNERIRDQSRRPASHVHIVGTRHSATCLMTCEEI